MLRNYMREFSSISQWKVCKCRIILRGKMKVNVNVKLKVKLKVKLSLCFLTEHHAMKAYWRVEV